MSDLIPALIATDPAHRHQWLLANRPADFQPVYWWLSLIESAVAGVRFDALGLPRNRPRADVSLAAAVIGWALEDGYPVQYAVRELVHLRSLAPAIALPAILQPDEVARRALDAFRFSRADAVAAAARLRALPVTDDDFDQPGDSPPERTRRFEELRGTDEYRDHQQLIAIEQMLDTLRPTAGDITDPALAAELAAWLDILPGLDRTPDAVRVAWAQLDDLVALLDAGRPTGDLVQRLRTPAAAYLQWKLQELLARYAAAGDTAARDQIAHVLAACGPAALPALLRSLVHDPETLRPTVRDLFERSPGEAMTQLKVCLADADPGLRRVGVWGLSVLNLRQSDEVVDLLVAATTDTDAAVRHLAAEALRTRPPDHGPR
ncbi:HEAT repeat domain-containing protein [Dactylosporangium sp. NPDC000521]|uniref:HEAT repeat domain-containing protein n=1 Tax=Dactylosporangium sp. NPDC000521 TaxID=3363975 RepID=UPI00367430B3